MKVKITRTIDLEEVPNHVEQIISECRRTLHDASNMLKAKMHDVPSMLNDLDEATSLLHLVEVKLQDASNISAGWHQALNTVSEIEDKEDEKDEQV